MALTFKPNVNSHDNQDIAMLFDAKETFDANLIYCLKKSTCKNNITHQTHISIMTANQRPADGPNKMIDSTIWPCEGEKKKLEELKQPRLTPSRRTSNS